MNISSLVGASLLALAASRSPAQSTLPRYTFQQNIPLQQSDRSKGEPANWVHKDRFEAMVSPANVGIPGADSDAVNAANAIMDAISYRLSHPSSASPSIDPNNITVHLYGLAQCAVTSDDSTVENLPTCLLHPDDAIALRGGVLDWVSKDRHQAPPLGSKNWKQMLYVNPWMYHSQARLTLWMNTFLDQIIKRHTASHLPLPRRFVIDSETAIVGTDELGANHMVNVRADPRWNSEQVLGYPPGTTMVDLELSANAQLETGWKLYEGDPTHLKSWHTYGFNRDYGDASHPENRPYAQFYLGVMANVRSAILRTAIFEPIKVKYGAYFAGHSGEIEITPETLSYADAVTSGESFKTGWYWERNLPSIENVVPACDAFQPQGPPDCGPRQTPEPLDTVLSTGIWNYFNYHPTNLTESLNFLPQIEGSRGGLTWLKTVIVPPDKGYTRWWALKSANGASLQGPVCYDWNTPIPGPGSHGVYSYIQNDLYTGQTETQWAACMRMNRMRLESTIVACNGHVETIAPYVRVPGVDGDFGVRIGTNESRNLLALLRQLDIRNIVPFTVRSPDDPLLLSDWQGVSAIDRQVYAFQVNSYYWKLGKNPTSTLPVPQDLFFTLRTTGPSPQDTVASATSVYTQTHTEQTMLVVDFVPLLPCPGDKLIINIEGSIEKNWSDSQVCDLNHVRGSVFAWDYTLPGGGNWTRLKFIENDSTANDYAISSGIDYSFRKSIEVCSGGRFIGPGNVVKLLLVHETDIACEEIGFSFVSHYDLVQVLRDECLFLTGTGTGSELTPPSLGTVAQAAANPNGADLDLDGTLTTNDVLLFAQAFSNGAPLADYDEDGDNTTQDVVLFVNDWVSGT